MITKSYVINTVYNEGVDNVIFIFFLFLFDKNSLLCHYEGKNCRFWAINKDLKSLCGLFVLS